MSRVDAYTPASFKSKSELWRRRKWKAQYLSLSYPKAEAYVLLLYQGLESQGARAKKGKRERNKRAE